MRSRTALATLIVLSALLLACALLRPQPTSTSVPTHTPVPVVLPATATPMPAASSTATREPTRTPAPTPTSTPVPPTVQVFVTPASPAKGYVVAEQRSIGGYTVSVWSNTSADSLGFDSIVTILGAGQPEVQIESASGLGSQSGTDLTGEGHPDLVVEVFTGGAHCCFSTIVYDLGPTLTKVLEMPLSNCGGSFQDLDSNGVAEFVTCDDRFAYAYCPYAGSPAVQVVLQYEPGRGYQPASPRFAGAYAEGIAQHKQDAESAGPGEYGEWDGTNKCTVLPLVLDYLYTGQGEQARSEFSRLYTAPDATLFWADIVQAVSDSPLYVGEAALPGISYPQYYMLQLVTHCPASDVQGAVGVLSQGQSACDPLVPRRDIDWLQSQLWRAGMLKASEVLSLAPDNCTDNCRLDIFDTTGSASGGNLPVTGSVRLDTTAGFPGEVYRVDDQEGEHWRLRGDLTWERVPR
jgi:hypothetical protein